MASNATVFIPSFMKINQIAENLLAVTDTQNINLPLLKQ
jgi:hypothetical protein